MQSTTKNTRTLSQSNTTKSAQDNSEIHFVSLFTLFRPLRGLPVSAYAGAASRRGCEVCLGPTGKRQSDVTHVIVTSRAVSNWLHSPPQKQ